MFIILESQVGNLSLFLMMNFIFSFDQLSSSSSHSYAAFEKAEVRLPKVAYNTSVKKKINIKIHTKNIQNPP